MMASIVRAFLLVTVCVVCALRVSFHFVSPVPPPEAPGGMDDPDGRDRFEWMRLKDPATGLIPPNMRSRELAFARTLQQLDAAPAGTDRALQSRPWTLRGPANVGGRTRALAFDVADEQILLAGGITGGMWRSTNQGLTWQRTSRTDQAPSVTCVAQDTRTGKTNTWYFGSGEYRTNVQRFGNALYYGNGIYKSTDDGRSWFHLDGTTGATNDQSPQPFNYVWNIVIDRSDAVHDKVYAAVYGGIARSLDGGASWQMVLGAGNNTSGFTNVAISSTGVLYAVLSSEGNTHGIFRSVDGLNWTDITPAGFPAKVRGITLDIAPSNERVVYVLAETPGSGKKLPSSYTDYEYYSLWKYTYAFGDGSGAAGQWVDRSANLPYFGDGHGFNYNGLASYALLIKVQPDDPNIVFLGGTNLYRLTDGFATGASTSAWRGGYSDNFNYGNGVLHPDQHALVFSNEMPGRIYIANDGGVWKMEDAAGAVPAWTPLDSQYVTGQFYTVAIDHGVAGSVTVMGGLQDNGTFAVDTMDANYPWQDMMGGDGAFCAMSDSQTAYVMSAQYTALEGYVTEGGPTFMYEQLAATTWTDNAMALFVNPFVLDPADTRILFAQYGGSIWRNTQIHTASPYKNWLQLANTATPDHALISALGMSRSTPAHRLYTGSTTGHVYRFDAINIDNPNLRDITDTKQFPAGAYINCIAVDPLDGNRAVVVFSNYNVQSLFLTTDGGTSWAPIGGNLEQNADGTGDGPSCRWAAFLHRGGQMICFVATSVGLYSASAFDGMHTVWTQEGADAIGLSMVSMIDVRQSDGYVAVATWGNGMFTTVIPPATPAAAPTLIAPVNGRTDVARDTLLTWNAVSNATSYSIAISGDPQFSTTRMFAANLIGTGVRASGLAADSTYYWHVRSVNDGGSGDWSAAWQFTTGTRTGIDGGSGAAASFVLDQASPNPARDRASIRFVLPRNERADMDLIDARGNTLRTLLSGSQRAGEHTIDLTASPLTAGTYFYRLTAGGRSVTRSFNVVR